MKRTSRPGYDHRVLKRKELGYAFISLEMVADNLASSSSGRTDRPASRYVIWPANESKWEKSADKIAIRRQA
jgi:hypothetical protein